MRMRGSMMQPPVWTWSPQDVAEYLQGLQDFGDRAREYAEVIMREDITGQTFLDLTDNDLILLKVTMGHRKLLLSRIAHLKHAAHPRGVAEAAADFISIDNA